jgi:hypothetical protein
MPNRCQGWGMGSEGGEGVRGVRSWVSVEGLRVWVAVEAEEVCVRWEGRRG